ncbi:hypothetical protein J7L29_01530, partial [Candidatus Bathyarchaeota archaeon]|nr:hypothetical protein [Candidatus Bathyarchaeota archaeon]
VLVEGTNVEKIIGHLKRGNLRKLRAQVNNMLEMLSDPRLADSLKSVFTIRKDVIKEIEMTYKVLKKIQEVI